jgi:GNAT superfamily N-acetyltransferase
MTKQFESVPGYELINGTDVGPSEIMDLRESVGWAADIPERWQACLAQSLHVSTVRDVESNELVGIGFLAGNERHAQVCDLAVRPEHQGRKIGTLIMHDLLRAANDRNITYVNLFHDSVGSPWLTDFYAKFGFRASDEGMELDE